MTTTNSETQALDNYLHIADGSQVFVVQDNVENSNLPSL